MSRIQNFSNCKTSSTRVERPKFYHHQALQADLVPPSRCCRCILTIADNDLSPAQRYQQVQLVHLPCTKLAKTFTFAIAPCSRPRGYNLSWLSSSALCSRFSPRLPILSLITWHHSNRPRHSVYIQAPSRRRLLLEARRTPWADAFRTWQAPCLSCRSCLRHCTLSQLCLLANELWSSSTLWWTAWPTSSPSSYRDYRPNCRPFKVLEEVGGGVLVRLDSKTLFGLTRDV